MNSPVVSLVLAGGTGTRLYPAARRDRPKQFLSLPGERSLLVRTIERGDFADETYVLTQPAFADGVRERLEEGCGEGRDAGGVEILVEPEAKDTGPALVYAAHQIREAVGECTLVCLPSDHLVEGDFAGTCTRAARVASETGRLVTIGIEPTHAATGYGYVEPDEDRGEYRTVASFHEKPNPETAARYVEAGALWNAGIFAWDAGAFLDAARDSPLAPLVDALESSRSDAAGDVERAFAAVESISVDRAVMERAESVAVVPADFAWDDLGTWDAVARHLDRDDDGNAVVGDALTVDAGDNVIATDGHVSVLGVDDLVVASYGDRTLVCPVDDAERVREVVDALREEGLF